MIFKKFLHPLWTWMKPLYCSKVQYNLVCTAPHAVCSGLIPFKKKRIIKSSLYGFIPLLEGCSF